jgi:ribosomal RNA-processing protein 9
MGRDNFFLDDEPKGQKIHRKKRMRETEQDKDSDNDMLGGDIDDMNLVDDGIEASDSEAEVEKRETAAEKRLRLAKQYLEKVHEDVAHADGEFDAAEIDRDLIAERLQTDAVSIF